MTDCPEKFPLSWLHKRADDDSCFAAEALKILEHVDSFQSRLRTHSIGSSASELIRRWQLDRELNGYEHGRMVDNFGSLRVIKVDGDFGIGNIARQDSIFIMRDELVALMQSYGMTIPFYLGGARESNESPGIKPLLSPTETTMLAPALVLAPVISVMTEKPLITPIINSISVAPIWVTRAIELANEIALKKYQNGQQEITARNTAKAVAKKLSEEKDSEGKYKWRGQRGPRSDGTVRTVALKGWEFLPPLD